MPPFIPGKRVLLSTATSDTHMIAMAPDHIQGHGFIMQYISILELYCIFTSPFVPITPLAALSASQTFFKATMDGAGGEIRAASSYDEWLVGCDTAGERRTTVYELASSLVREPMGGFDDPPLQHMFVFARLVAIVSAHLGQPGGSVNGDRISVIAAIAAGNKRSLGAMKELGMERVETLPRWLDYEHRAWFPLIGPERPQDEADYLWLPGAAAKKVLARLSPFASGERPLRRPNRDAPTSTEAFRVAIDTNDYRNLLDERGSIGTAVAAIDPAMFVPPPDLALLDPDRAPAERLNVAF